MRKGKRVEDAKYIILPDPMEALDMSPTTERFEGPEFCTPYYSCQSVICCRLPFGRASEQSSRQ